MPKPSSLSNTPTEIKSTITELPSCPAADRRGAERRRTAWCFLGRSLSLLALAVFAPLALTAAEALVFDQPQLAGISGFRAFWDLPVVLAENGLVIESNRTPGGAGPNAIWSPAEREEGVKPGAILFDAVHRSVLVRFPGSAQRIADALGQGSAVEKVELVLPHQATELWAEGYAEPPGMSFLGDSWEKQKPRWYAVAWALRQPWMAGHLALLNP